MEDLASKIQAHLSQVIEEPGTDLDHVLLGSLDRRLSDVLPKDIVISLITQIARLLPTLQQDHAPVTSLAEILAGGSSLTFSDVLAIQPPIPFVEGLSNEAPGFNLVTLSLLEKTGESQSDVGILASKLDIVTALINLWLRTRTIVVASKAYKVLSLLLHLDTPEQQLDPAQLVSSETKDLTNPSSSLMWRRIVTDKDVYSLFFSLTSLQTADHPGQLSKKQKTISQGRLLDFLKDFSYAPQIWISHIPIVEAEYVGNGSGGSLLEFAACHMVDFKDDPLMHVSLVDFYTSLLSHQRKSTSKSDQSHSTTALDFLLTHSLHQRTASYFLQPESQDPLDISFLYPAAGRYISAYVLNHPHHFLALAQSAFRDQLLTHLYRRIKSTSKGELANDRAPKDELNLLSSLPRVCLLPTTERESSFLLLALKPANIDVLVTLGRVFQGPNPSGATALVRESQKNSEASAARALFLLYVATHPTFWNDLMATASLVAFPSVAKAALGVLHCLITANWNSTPSSISQPSEATSQASIPTEATLASNNPYTPPLPTSGLASLLLSPAIERVLPYLLKGAENDSEEAFEVAKYKYEVLREFESELEKMVAREEREERKELVRGLVTAVERRVRAGVLGMRRNESGGAEQGTGERLGVATESR